MNTALAIIQRMDRSAPEFLLIIWLVERPEREEQEGNEGHEGLRAPTESRSHDPERQQP